MLGNPRIRSTAEIVWRERVFTALADMLKGMQADG